MARGDVSAARTTSSEVPRFRVFVAIIAFSMAQDEDSGMRPTLVRALLQLSVVTSLLTDIQYFLRQGFVGERPCCNTVRLIFLAEFLQWSHTPADGLSAIVENSVLSMSNFK